MDEVIVENRKTGQRKQMTPLMAKHLELKYRIVEEAALDALEKSINFKPPAETKTELERLRLEYFKLFNQQPHHRLGEAKLKQLIDEAKS